MRCSARPGTFFERLRLKALGAAFESIEEEDQNEKTLRVCLGGRSYYASACGRINVQFAIGQLDGDKLLQARCVRQRPEFCRQDRRCADRQDRKSTRLNSSH